MLPKVPCFFNLLGILLLSFIKTEGHYLQPSLQNNIEICLSKKITYGNERSH